LPVWLSPALRVPRTGAEFKERQTSHAIVSTVI
jgi:hypothetical protein